MDCIFPGAADREAYWRNILAGLDATGDPPPDWEAARYYDPDASANDRIYCKRGGYLGDLARFDPVAHGVMPNSVDGGEPDQFLALEVAQRALADAAHSGCPIDGERAEVVIGRGTYINRGFVTVVQHGLVVEQTLEVLRRLHPEHGEEELALLKEELKAALPPFNADMAPALVPNVMSGRIANRLDFRGPNFTIDAACASSLIAVERAMQDLEARRCDLALVGGVHCSTPAPILMIFCQLEALSREGRLRPFDERADGTLLGEGAGFVVLKRREDAKSDGDRVYAVLRAVGTSSDGRALGLLAPRVEGEELALERAYELAGLPPESVGLIEAHGTGTRVGDATEMRAIRRIFGERHGLPRCALGCVKSMIAHLIPAAGMAGLIKTALALHHKVLPPTLNCDRPNPELELETSPVYLNTETRPWVHGGPEPRRAAVNAFGFGGINAHAILEEHLVPVRREPATGALAWESEVVVLEGRTREELGERLEEIRAWLADGPGPPLPDLARALNASLADPPAAQRLAVVASSLDELGERLATAADRLAERGRSRIRDPAGVYWFREPLGAAGGVAFLFPGEGSQYAGMLADLCLRIPEARHWFDLVDRAFADHDRAEVPSDFIFPPPGQEGPGDRLWAMDGAGEALFAANQAMLAVLGLVGVRPDAVLGHSSGEYSALLASGALRLEDEEALVASTRELHAIYRTLSDRGEIPQAALLAVATGDRDVVDAVVCDGGERLSVAMDNCPHQVVLSGEAVAIRAAAARLGELGAVCSPVPFDRAYHTPVFTPFTLALRGHFSTLEFSSPEVPLYSCATAARFPAEPEAVRTLAAQQWSRPVRFQETVKAMHDDGIRVFVESGPRGNLCAFVDDILRGRDAVAVPLNVEGRSGITQLNHCLATLAAHGVPLRLDRLYAGRGVPTVDLERAEPANAPEASSEPPLSLALPRLRLDGDRVAAGRPAERLPAAEAPARSAGRPERPLPAGETPPAARDAEAPGTPDPVLDAYFATMARFVEGQRRVMLAALGEPAGGEERADGTDGAGPEAAGAPGGGLGPALEAPFDPAPAPDLPFVRQLVELEPGRSLAARCELRLDEDLYLLDHTLETGTASTRDSDLVGLPIVPLAMSLEMLAEAAVALVPDATVVGMRDVEASRWIALDDERVTLELAASADEGAAEVRAELHESGPAGEASREGSPPAVRATVLLGDERAGGGDAGPFPLRADRPPAVPPDRLYGCTAMFHGPAFRVVSSLDRIGEDGIEATLIAPPNGDLLASRPEPGFLIDPVVLDGMGQVIAYWVGERFERGVNVFPFRLESLTLHGSPLAPGDQAGCRARVRELDDARMRSDIEVVGRDGAVLVRMTGWEDRRIDVPQRMREFFADPAHVELSRRWDAPLAGVFGAEQLRCRLLDAAPADLLLGHGEIWLRALAHLALGRRERDAWRALRSATPKRRLEWVRGRLAAKDAVRTLVAETTGERLAPADVEVSPDEHGRPCVASLPASMAPPALAISHTGDVAAAVAGPAGMRVGIDLEGADAVSVEVEYAAFAAAERERLEALNGWGAGERLARGWCAKEAVAKALGRGLDGGPRALEIVRADGSGALEVGCGHGLSGAPADLAATLPGLSERPLPVITGSEGRIAFATCCLGREDPE